MTGQSVEENGFNYLNASWQGKETTFTLHRLGKYIKSGEKKDINIIFIIQDSCGFIY